MFEQRTKTAFSCHTVERSNKHTQVNTKLHTIKRQRVVWDEMMRVESILLLKRLHISS